LIDFLALASAAVYGAADFLGGLAFRRASTFAVVIVSQLAGLILLAALLPVLPDAQVSTRDLAWGMAAGVTGGAGVALLYRALAVGTMAVVAPTTAVCAAAIPVLASIALGERPSLRVAAGIALAVVAILLVSRSKSQIPNPKSPKTGLGLALMSGVAIGWLARLVLGERLDAWQGAGIACALVAVVLIVG
jgi:uncharacterized membrane protein